MAVAWSAPGPPQPATRLSDDCPRHYQMIARDIQALCNVGADLAALDSHFQLADQPLKL
jgi:hypothetical protein